VGVRKKLFQFIVLQEASVGPMTEELMYGVVVGVGGGPDVIQDN